MLYDPKWDVPSVAGFRAWLERQDPDATFNYSDCNYCAVAQYLASVGTSWCATRGSLVSELNNFAVAAWVAAGRRDGWDERPTFGAVLREMDNETGKRQ
jgi:hypothetical protein